MCYNPAQRLAESGWRTGVIRLALPPSLKNPVGPKEWEAGIQVRNLIILFALLALVSVGGCASAKEETLTVLGGEPVNYTCENGEQIVARYYSLSDDSLDFVKVTMPDGQELTLPNAVSASGARYTDDREWVWWTKGESAFAETRDESGEWQVKYDNCQQVAK